MLESRLSRALLLLGATVGVVSVGVWALELRVNLPDWMVRVAMIKLAFLASAGLMATGALVGRHAKTRLLTGPPPEIRIGESAGQPLKQRNANPSPLDIERESDTPP